MNSIYILTGVLSASLVVFICIVLVVNGSTSIPAKRVFAKSGQYFIYLILLVMMMALTWTWNASMDYRAASICNISIVDDICGK